VLHFQQNLTQILDSFEYEWEFDKVPEPTRQLLRKMVKQTYLRLNNIANNLGDHGIGSDYTFYMLAHMAKRMKSYHDNVREERAAKAPPLPAIDPRGHGGAGNNSIQ
jgi:hypothetical protein